MIKLNAGFRRKVCEPVQREVLFDITRMKIVAAT